MVHNSCIPLIFLQEACLFGDGDDSCVVSFSLVREHAVCKQQVWVECTGHGKSLDTLVRYVLFYENRVTYRHPVTSYISINTFSTMGISKHTLMLSLIETSFKYSTKKQEVYRKTPTGRHFGKKCLLTALAHPLEVSI